MASPFDIAFRFTDGNSSYAAIADAAASFWELAITADLPDTGGVDDLRIDAHLNLIGSSAGDGRGGVLANAGPRAVRSGSSLPYLGELGIDPADIGNPGLRAILVHEIGHILGLPGVARLRGLIAEVGTENRWTGANAVAEYRILANDPAAPFVRMQEDSGAAQGGHWDEDLFGAELLTPSIDTSRPAPLSRMTLAALRDIGYTVDLGASDPFALPGTPAAARDDRSGNFNATAVLGIGASATGAIELPEDNDWFRVELAAGRSYVFELNGSATGAGSLGDPFLALRAANGDILASDDESGAGANARLAYTAGSAGSYFLDAAAAGPGTGSYTLVASQAAAAPPPAPVALTPGDGLDVFRFHNAGTGRHFYTTSAPERDLVRQTMPEWRYEGYAFDSSATAADGIAVHRFYSADRQAHFYATGAEAESVRGSGGEFGYEGVAYYAFAGPGPDRAALYRFHNAATGSHFYTADGGERNAIASSMPEWRYEGIAYYIDLL